MHEEINLLEKKTTIVEKQVLDLNAEKNMLEKEEQYYYKKYKRN